MARKVGSGMIRSIVLAPGLLLALVACQADDTAAPIGEATAEGPAQAAGATMPDADSTEAYDGIAPDEILHFTGTEPFWGGEVMGRTLRYSTPEDQDGSELAVERFAGRGGLSFSGQLDAAPFEMMVTPLECSDGMSDRTYPFTVTLKIGEETRNGCGWTDRQSFAGPAQP
jgi:uncharacterized membrane protein